MIFRVYLYVELTYHHRPTKQVKLIFSASGVVQSKPVLFQAVYILEARIICMVQPPDVSIFKRIFKNVSIFNFFLFFKPDVFIFAVDSWSIALL